MSLACNHLATTEVEIYFFCSYPSERKANRNSVAVGYEVMALSAYGARHMLYNPNALRPLQEWMCVRQQTRQIRKRKDCFLRDLMCVCPCIVAYA